MSEENETSEEEIFEEDGTGEKGHGPGLRLGILVGLIVGAAVAVFFAPPTGVLGRGLAISWK